MDIVFNGQKWFEENDDVIATESNNLEYLLYIITDQMN